MSLSPRFSVWLLAVLLLILAFLLSWNRFEPEVEQVAFATVEKRILERANYYKQFWVLHKFPPEKTLEGVRVHYSSHGWVLPLHEDQLDCDYWFQLLYPKGEVFGENYALAEGEGSTSGYLCRYKFTEGREIILSLQGEKFRVDVKSESRPE